MTDRDQSSVTWRDVARSVPGGVGIQRGEILVYVSQTFSEIVGMEEEELQDYPWQVLFEPRKIEEIETALDTARTEGRWEGDVKMGDLERAPVELRLSCNDESDFVIWSITEKRTHQQLGETNPETLLMGKQSRLARTVLSTIDDIVYVIGDDGQFWFWNEQVAETTGYEYERIGEMSPKELIPEDQHEYVPGLLQALESIEDRRVRVDMLTADGERIPHEFSGTTFEQPETGRSFRCGIARDISERLEREQKIRRQRDELATLNRINDLLFETTQEVIRTGDKGPIMQVLCEQAVGSEFYQCAWVGQRERGTNQLTRVASEGVETDREAGDDGPIPDSDDHDIVRQAVDADGPAVSVCRTPSEQQWCDTTEKDGVESVAAIALDHGDVVYGCLVLGTQRTNAFTDRERTALEVLGHQLGTVLHAARTQKLVFSSSVVELEFGSTNYEPLPVEPEPDADGTVTLEGIVPSSGGWVLYLSIEGGATDGIVDTVRASPEVERARRITDGSRSERVEVVISSSPLLETVTNAGASLQEATVSPDGTRFLVAAPSDADVSHIADRIIDTFPSADLLASRERDAELAPMTQQAGILDDLTTRQRDVLEAAYQAGYFRWPRDSTAEEVAEALGLARPTVHAHLRKGERTILSALLGGSQQ